MLYLVMAVAAAAASVPPSEHAEAQPSPARPVGWRRDGSGRYPTAEPVLRWSANEHVRWKTEVGAGQSSPVVVGQRLLITVESNLLVCLETESGRKLWRRNLTAELTADPGIKELKYSSQYGDITPTPVSDGKSVWVVTGTGMVASYDLDGKMRWAKAFDCRPSTTYGRTASPVLVGGRLLVHLGPLIGLDAATGNVLWKNETAKATYGTPVPTRIGDVDVVITPKGQVVRAADGRILAADLGNCMYTSPVIQDRVVYFIDGTMTAVRLPETITDPVDCKELWYADLPGEFYASPIVDGPFIYTVDKAGRYYVIDAVTGKIAIKKQPEWSPTGATENANVYPSICQAGKHLFISNDAGETLILEPGDRAAKAGGNTLPAGSGATPVFAGQRMFVRAGKALYCIGQK